MSNQGWPTFTISPVCSWAASPSLTDLSAALRVGERAQLGSEEDGLHLPSPLLAASCPRKYLRIVVQWADSQNEVQCDLCHRTRDTWEFRLCVLKTLTSFENINLDSFLYNWLSPFFLCLYLYHGSMPGRVHIIPEMTCVIWHHCVRTFSSVFSAVVRAVTWEVGSSLCSKWGTA